MSNLPNANEFFTGQKSDPSDYLENQGGIDPETASDLPVPPTYNPVQESVNNFHSNTLQRTRNPYQMGKVQPFGAGLKEHAFERYYEHPKFDSLGFTPFRDNETFYNEQSNAWDDFRRATGQFGKIFTLGFKDAAGFGSLTDIDTAREYEKAMGIGQSSRGGVSGFGINLFMNFGYTAGIMGEMIAEEAALYSVGALTGGSTWGVATARGAQKISKLRDVWQMGKNTFKALENLQDVNKARAYFKNARKAGTRFLNPLEQTTDFYKMGKAGKVGDLDMMAKTSAGLGAFYRDIRNLRLVYGESALEGGMVQNQMEEELLAVHYDKYDRPPTEDEARKIKETANMAGKSTALWNMPVIFLSNKIVFDNLYRGFNPIRRLTTNVVAENVGGKIIKTGAKEAPYQVIGSGFKGFIKGLRNPRSYARTGLNYFRANFAEGLQESAQEVISGTTRDYYTDNFNSTLRGGIYSYIGENIQKQLTPEGGEIFLSGFLMGGMAGAVTKPIELGFKRIKQGKDYQDIKAKRAENLNYMTNTLNDMYDNPMQYFAPDIENLVNQHGYQRGMRAAADSGDYKTYYDLKDASTFEHIFTALQTNRLDDYIDLLESYKSMNDEEVQEATGGVVKTRDEFDQVINSAVKRAKHIQSRYEVLKERFPNPFNPSLYKHGSDEFNDEFDKYRSFELASRTMLFMGQSFDRTLERMNSLREEIASDSDLKNVLSSDYDPLLSMKALTDATTSLKEELTPLKEQELLSKDAKAFKNDRQRRLSLLDSYTDALTDYFSLIDSVKEEDRDQKVSKEGEQQVEVESKAERKAVKKLKKAYDNYLRYLASASEDHIFKENIDSAFQKLLDYYQLDDEAGILTKAVNALTDPKGFTAHAEDWRNTMRILRENKKLHLEKSLAKYQEIMDQNELAVALHDDNMFFDPNQLQALLTEGKLPDTFYYAEGKDAFNPVPENSEDYNKAVETAMKYVEHIQEKEVPEKADVYAERETEKAPGDNRTYADYAEQFGFDPKKPESSVPLENVLQVIIDSSYITEEQRLLAKKLRPIALPGEFVTFARNMAQVGTYAELTQTKVDPRYASSDFPNQQGAPLEITILKQEIKRQTHHGLQSDARFKKEIKELFDRVTQHYETLKETEESVVIPHGLTDHATFVSEVMNNPDFQAILADIPYEGTVGGNSWTGFIDAVLRMLKNAFGKNTSNTALNAALHVITTQIEKEAGVGKGETTPAVGKEITRYTPAMEMPEDLRNALVQVYKDYNAEREANFETVADRDWKDKSDDQLASSVQFQIYLEQGFTKVDRLIREYTKPKKEAVPDQEISSIITREMKSRLKTLGYTDIEIRIMSPKTASDVINRGVSKFEQQAEREAMEEAAAKAGGEEGRKAREQINGLINDAGNIAELEQARKDISVIVSDHKTFSQTGLTSEGVAEMVEVKKRELAFTVQADQLKVGQVVIMNDNYSTRMVISKINKATVDLHKVGDITFTRRVKKVDVTDKIKYRYSETMETIMPEKEKVSDKEKKLSNEDVQTAQVLNDQQSIAEDIKAAKDSTRDKLVDDIFEDIETCD